MIFGSTYISRSCDINVYPLIFVIILGLLWLAIISFRSRFYVVFSYVPFYIKSESKVLSAEVRNEFCILIYFVIFYTNFIPQNSYFQLNFSKLNEFTNLLMMRFLFGPEALSYDYMERRFWLFLVTTECKSRQNIPSLCTLSRLSKLNRVQTFHSSIHSLISPIIFYFLIFISYQSL